MCYKFQNKFQSGGRTITRLNETESHQTNLDTVIKTRYSSKVNWRESVILQRALIQCSITVLQSSSRHPYPLHEDNRKMPFLAYNIPNERALPLRNPNQQTDRPKLRKKASLVPQSLYPAPHRARNLQINQNHRSPFPFGNPISRALMQSARSRPS